MARIVWASGGDADSLSVPQREKINEIRIRHGLTDTVEVSPCFGGDGAVMLNTGTMWIGIEIDGYAHT
jgi:hypothetical protein